MPTYDYRCTACAHEFELFQSMRDPVKRKCPECGRSALERLIGTGAAILFKGSGFYETDYRSESYKKAADADKPAAAPASNTSETKDSGSGAKSAETGAKRTETGPAPSGPTKPGATKPGGVQPAKPGGARPSGETRPKPARKAKASE